MVLWPTNDYSSARILSLHRIRSYDQNCASDYSSAKNKYGRRKEIGPKRVRSSPTVVRAPRVALRARLRRGRERLPTSNCTSRRGPVPDCRRLRSRRWRAQPLHPTVRPRLCASQVPMPARTEPRPPWRPRGSHRAKSMLAGSGLILEKTVFHVASRRGGK